MKNKYDLSIGMIVKNEEKYLEQCLKALLPLKELISCEIIVTDTGSTDKTVEIAEKYADTVLHFEWCDDFAAARNTGVEVAQADWFMFIDADEIFDNSVVNIAEFIKSRGRDVYDHATVIIRNFKDDALKIYQDIPLKRLFNFTKGKRRFEGKIHENFSFQNEMFSVRSTALHYGYIPQIARKKQKRNRALLEKEYEESPNDLKVIRHFLCCVESSYMVTLSERAIEIVNSGEKNNYKDLKNITFIFSIFCELAFYYVTIGQNDLIIETCKKYFNTKFIELNNKKPCYPTLEIYFMLGLAYFQKKQYEESLETFLKYQKMYQDLILKPNNFLESAYTYKFNKDIEYQKSGNFVMDIYKIIGDKESFENLLTKSELYKYALQDENLTNVYVQKIILIDRKDLFEKVISYFKENGLEEKCSKIDSILISKIYFNNDLSYFTNNFCTDSINKTMRWGYQFTPKIKNIIYNILSKDIEVNNLKEMKIYIQIAYTYLVSVIDLISKEDVGLEFKRNVDDIFEFYIESMLYYINAAYTQELLQNENLDILKKEEVMSLVLSVGFENRHNDIGGYIKSLKEALKYNDDFKYIILNSINVVENETPQVLTMPKDDEFELLALKIKQSISILIIEKDLEQAKVVLEQYKSINPTDPDIDKFIKLMI